MKVLQLNIWGGRLMNNIHELLEVEKPDIVCLQEVISAQGDVGLFIGTLEELQTRLKYEYAFYAPVFEFKLMNTTAQFGNCILSTHPFTKTETIFTNLEFVKNFDFAAHSYNIRNLQHVVIEVNGAKLNVLNHHGHHIPDHKNGDLNTLRQMKQISEYISNLSGPVILTGDFNLAPHSESIEWINKDLDNLSITYDLPTTRTPLTHKSEVCDYIFTSKDIKVKDFRASEAVASDHKALIVEFELPKGQ